MTTPDMATVTFNIADLGGNDVTKVEWLVEVNAENGRIEYDTHGWTYYGGARHVFEASGELELPVKAGANPVDFEYKLTPLVTVRNGTRGDYREPYYFPAPATAVTVNITTLAAESTVPASWLTAATQQLTNAGQSALSSTLAARDAAVAASQAAEAAAQAVEELVITDLGTTDGQTKALIESGSSQTRTALNNAIGILPVSLGSNAAANVAAINAAVAEANTRYLAGSGVTKIVMPEGTYPVRRSAGSGHAYAVRILSGVELCGAGEGKTTLVVEPFNLDHGFYESGWAEDGFYQSIFYAKGTAEDLLRDVYLHDFTVDGNKDNMLGAGPNANAGDTFDVTFADESVTLERLTVVNSSSDAFDYDDCTEMVVRFCTAIAAAGFGYHNSENNNGVVQIGNVARGCGFGGNNRGGFDQYATSTNGVYIGCVSVGNYRNFEIRGSRATVVGCHSGSIGTQPDVFEGAALYMQPGASKGELGLFGSTGRLRFADQSAPAEPTRRWLQYVANNAMSWLRGSVVALLIDQYFNVGIGGMSSRGGTAEKALLISDGTAPTSNPTGGVIAGSRSGTPYVRTSGGRLVTLAGNVATPTTNYTVAATDEIVLAVGGSGGITITLPVLVNGMRFTIKKVDAPAGAVTVAGTGANIDGAATKVLAAQYDHVTVVAATGAWHIV